MDGSDGGRKEANLFLSDERFWQGAAFVTGVLLIFAVGLAALISLFTSTGVDLNRNVDTIYKLGLIGVGFVTFCTVVWRGLIAARQANTQQQQIVKLTEQIAAAERQNLAGLFHKGAEMIAEGDHANVAAGLSTLQIVAQGPDEDFAIQAMNIIADHIEEQGPDYLTKQRGQNAVATLNRVARQTSRYSQRRLSLEFPSHIVTEIESEYIPLGAGHVTLSRVGFVFDDFDNIEPSNKAGSRRILLTHCRFDNCTIDMRKFRVKESEFKACKFIYWVSTPGNKYTDCDFSGCDIRGKFPDLRQANCFFNEVDPPRGRSITYWSRRLQRHGGTDLADDSEDDDIEPAIVMGL